MKFSCGRTFKAEEKRRGQWRRWFAWRPVNVEITKEGEFVCMWLCWLERRQFWVGSWGDSGWSSEYRAIKN